MSAMVVGRSAGSAIVTPIRSSSSNSNSARVSESTCSAASSASGTMLSTGASE